MTAKDNDEPEVIRALEEGPMPAVEPAADTSSTIALPGDILPPQLHILPTLQRPFFPVQAMPVSMPAEPTLETVAEVAKTPQRALGLLLARPGHDPKFPKPGEMHRIGTVVRVHNAQRNDDQVQMLVEGVQRFEVVEWVSTTAPYVAQVRYLDDEQEALDDETKAYAMAILGSIRELVSVNPMFSQEVGMHIERTGANRPSALAHFGGTLSTADGEVLQKLLAARALKERMKRSLELLHKELDVARMQAEIRTQVEERIGTQQREFFLREQLKAIQQELGIAKDDRTAEVDRFRERLDKLTLTEDATRRVDEEMDKFAVLEPGSPEYAVTRNYLDWLTVLPWGQHSRDRLDLRRARKVLDEDHFGLEDVKERIIEFLAVGKLRGTVGGSIVLLIGPPGVGKTSIGKSVAEAVGRKFFRFSVGGMRDEAEIKGHRRTYIGAMPGKFIQALKDVGTSNPVLMIDEVDKIGASYQGDPASALLEALDPEQNAEFLDHYLDVRFDLSNVLFICTANQLDTIPGPLLDRMEVIRLSGYIAQEKVEIAKRHLWPRQLERAGVKRSQVKLSDSALAKIVEGYAREAGVRNLDKLLGRIIRKVAVRLGRGNRKPLSVTGKNLEDLLGKPPFRNELARRGAGVVNGLAWTSMGGATLTVEATRVHDDGRGFKLTGQLGDVMRESAEIAYSFVTANLARFGAPADAFDKLLVHLHVPEGATPKDGPSAGITMATALISLALNKRLPRVMAMTGELTLTGEVLPVGGIREKVIAARRTKIAELVLPEANRRDYEELPDYLRDGLTVHFARRYDEVHAVVFG